MFIPIGITALFRASLILLSWFIHFHHHIGISGILQGITLDNFHQQTTSGGHQMSLHAVIVLFHVVLFHRYSCFRGLGAKKQEGKWKKNGGCFKKNITKNDLYYKKNWPLLVNKMIVFIWIATITLTNCYNDNVWFKC